jgi:hypothetical protein
MFIMRILLCSGMREEEEYNVGQERPLGAEMNGREDVLSFGERRPVEVRSYGWGLMGMVMVEVNRLNQLWLMGISSSNTSRYIPYTWPFS